MTLIEIFNKCKKHLITQNKKCIHETGGQTLKTNLSYDAGTPAYNIGDLYCPVGALFPAGFDFSQIDGYNANSDYVEKALIAANIIPAINNEKHITLLCELQYIHDEYDPSLWEEKLNTLHFNYFNTLDNINIKGHLKFFLLNSLNGEPQPLVYGIPAWKYAIYQEIMEQGVVFPDSAKLKEALDQKIKDIINEIL